MKKFWKAGDRSRGICEACARVVETRFEYRTYTLDEPAAEVPGVLVAACAECGRTVGVPFQSSPRLNAARRAADVPLEARIPRHLEDVLAVVGSHYGRLDPQFRAVVLRFYLHALAESATLAGQVRKLAGDPLAAGPAEERLSLKLQEDLLARAWASARAAGVRTRTEMVKGAILAAADDLDSRAGKRRRAALADLAASA